MSMSNAELLLKLRMGEVRNGIYFSYKQSQFKTRNNLYGNKKDAKTKGHEESSCSKQT